MAQTSSCEVCDVPKGQARTGDSIQPFVSEAVLICLGAVLSAAFKKIKNRGNELKDLLQRQGITEIAASKRTHFRAERSGHRRGTKRHFEDCTGMAVPWLERSYTIRGRASPTPRVATFQMLYRNHHCALSGQRLPGSVLIWPVTPASSRQWSRQDGGATTKLGDQRLSATVAASGTSV